MRDHGLAADGAGAGGGRVKTGVAARMVFYGSDHWRGDQPHPAEGLGGLPAHKPAPSLWETIVEPAKNSRNGEPWQHEQEGAAPKTLRASFRGFG